MSRNRKASALVLALVAIQGGCYVYAAPVNGQPTPGSRYAFEITDQGRVHLAERLGSGVETVEGMLLSNNGEGYVISVTSVKTIGTTPSHWGGERVAIQPTDVARVRQRRLSRGRTVAATSAALLAVGAFVATRALAGGGQSRHPGDPPPCCDQ